MKSKLLSILVYLALLLSLTYPYTDFDWGWHYRYGEHFVKTGTVLRQDKFSWILPNYEWINHSWGYDLLVYWVYTLSGFKGFLYLGPLIMFAIFYIAVAPYKLSAWKVGVLAPIYYFGTISIYNQGLRSQIIGLLLLSILLFFIRKRPWLAPFIILLWVNMHGSFVVGLTIVLIYYIYKTVLQKHSIGLLVIVLLSTIATFINPFGYKVYAEIFRHLGSPWLQYIYEWRSVEWGISPRNLTLLLVTLLPVTAFLLSKVNMGIFKWVWFRVGVALVAGYVIGIAVFDRIPSIHFQNYSMKEYCEFGSHCSPSILAILKVVPPNGRGFNFYDWGGFLVGGGIQQKIFLYGAMTLWEKDGYVPFSDSLGIYAGYVKVFNKHNFDWVVIQSSSPLAQKLLSTTDLGKWKSVFSDMNTLYAVRVP